MNGRCANEPLRYVPWPSPPRRLRAAPRACSWASSTLAITSPLLSPVNSSTFQVRPANAPLPHLFDDRAARQRHHRLICNHPANKLTATMAVAVTTIRLVSIVGTLRFSAGRTVTPQRSSRHRQFAVSARQCAHIGGQRGRSRCGDPETHCAGANGPR